MTEVGGVAKARMNRRRQQAFLAAYMELGTVAAAMKAVGIGPLTHHQWLQAQPEYAEAFALAREAAADLLEAEAVRRALEGVEQPVFYQGKPCGAVRRYSDTLMMFLLKAMRPERFRDRAARQADTDEDADGALTVNVLVPPGAEDILE